VAEIAREVDAEPARPRRKVFPERLEVERYALERGRSHALHHREQRAQVGAVFAARGCDREPAVARERGGDTVVARGDRVGIERDLRVVVGVQVDDARRDDPPVGVDRARGARAIGHVSDRDDPAARDRDVGAPPREPRAVDHDAAADHEVVAHTASRCARTIGGSLRRIVARIEHASNPVLALEGGGLACATSNMDDASFYTSVALMDSERFADGSDLPFPADPEALTQLRNSVLRRKRSRMNCIRSFIGDVSLHGKAFPPRRTTVTHVRRTKRHLLTDA
jgi:hypothetical protein